ncbi:outer membrane protein [Helicobacter cetorum]|uniref:Outer membrane protein HopG n=1 Tax=Helicobacter cetorum (strain ATCC BAA-429 / MIT 00-7128) TaxID=182217 RepID=I0ENU8_HELC0|nr:outer membrane protein [Helicobacter cetorum]AFI04617.1 outer membrane protein HopG [Helicobacter cetorum MIT 00-7128]
MPLLNSNQLDTLSNGVSSQITNLQNQINTLGSSATAEQKTQLAQLNIQKQAINVLQALQQDPSLFKNPQIENLAKSLQLNAGITQNGVGIMSLGLVMIQTNELLQLIKNNPTTNLIQTHSKEQPTLITNNYATHSSPTSTTEVLKSLDSLRLSSIKGYLEGYLEELNGMMNGQYYQQGFQHNITLNTIKTKVQSILSALNSNQAFNSSSITESLKTIIDDLNANTIGRNDTITDKEILQNGLIGWSENEGAKITPHAYLTPNFGINSLMLFQMLQGIAKNQKDVNYAYALSYAFQHFRKQYVNFFSNEVYNGCAFKSNDCGKLVSPPTLQNLIEKIDPKLIPTYKQLLNKASNEFQKTMETADAIGSASAFTSAMTTLKNKISALANSNDKQQALNIIDKMLTDIPIYDAQSSNFNMQLSAWMWGIVMNSPTTVHITVLSGQTKNGVKENSSVVISGSFVPADGCSGNCSEYQYTPKIKTPQQLYHAVSDWWNNMGNIANALNSHNPKEIGVAIQSFGNFYNEQWKNNPHYQQGGSYLNKNQIKQILNNINTSLPKADQQTLHFTFMALPTNSTNTLSQQHQATYNTLQVSKPIALASLSTLASMFNNMNYLSSPTTTFTNNDKVIESKQQGYMLGFGIKGGYKQMFNHYIKGNRESKKKYGQFGLRYYAFLDYNYGVLSQRNTNQVNMNMLTYGVGLDILVNIFENKLASYGIFGGFQIAGNSWLATRNYSSSMKDKIRATHFQCLFDFGLRTNILSHHGIELGVKIPMLSQRYIDVANYKVNYKREYVYYVGYVWGF